MEKVRIIFYFTLSVLFASCSCNYNHKIDKMATEIYIWGADSTTAIRFHDVCTAEMDSLNNLPLVSRKKKDQLSAYFYRNEVYAFISSGMIDEAIEALDEYGKLSRNDAIVSLMRPCVMSYKAFLEHNSVDEVKYKNEMIESYRVLCEKQSSGIKRDLRRYIRSLNSGDEMLITAAQFEFLEDYFFLKRTGTITDSWTEYESFIRSLDISDDLTVYKEEYLAKDDLVVKVFLPGIVCERWL